MKGLSQRQEEILNYISSSFTKNGYAPSLKEIGEHFSFSPAAAHYALLALSNKGFIEYKKGKKRSITLIKEERERRENIPIPFYKTEPNLSELGNRPNSTFLIPLSLYKEGSFSFCVSSLSMTDSGIIPGDIAIIEKKDKYKDGDIVLADKGDYSRFELRRLHLSPSYMELWAENDSMGIIRSQSFSLYGCLVEIIRKYKND